MDESEITIILREGSFREEGGCVYCNSCQQQENKNIQNNANTTTDKSNNSSTN